MKAAPFVALKDVAKRWNGQLGVEHIDLEIEEGSFVALLGPSGCGKSTTLRLLAGLEAADEGRILIDGRDVTTAPASDRNLSMVFQSYALFPHLSVAENVVFGLKVRRVPKAERAEKLARALSITGLEGYEVRKPGELSGGQRQRVALARAIVAGKRLCLMDEPLSNLDAKLRNSVRKDIKRLQRDLGITVVYVTHDQTEAMTLADRLVVLDRGRPQQVGTPQDLYARPANLFVAQFIGSPPMNLLDGLVQGGRIRAGPIDVPIPSDVPVVPEGERVTLGLRPEEIHVGKPSASSEQAASLGSGMLGLIRLVEPIGGHTWATVEVAGPGGPRTLVGLADRKTKAKPGDRVALTLTRAECQLFDSRTGRRLGTAHD